MAKVPVPVEAVLNNNNLSISSSPFSPGSMIIKRASFKGGEVPAPLESFLFNDGHEGSGMEGTVVAEGKPIPRSAAAIKEQRGPGDYTIGE